MAREELKVNEQQDKEEGATLVEYALLAALIAVALFAIVAFFMNDVSKSFSRIGSAIIQ